MAKIKNKNSNKIKSSKRLYRRYTFSVLNEGTLEEVYKIRTTPAAIIGIVVAILVLLFTIYTCLLAFTPIRKLLPESTDYALRSQVVNHAMSIDSLQKVMELNQRYLDNVSSIFSGELKLEDDDNMDSVVVKAATLALMEKSEKEKAFAEKFEEEEMYNFSNRSDESQLKAFFAPVQGTLTRAYDAASGHFGIDIAAEEGAAVSATTSGAVLSSGYDHRDGYYIEILHDDSFVSVYRGLSEVFKASGDVVEAGDVIGLAGKHENRNRPLLHFELWSSTMPQNPMNYIVLE